MSADLILTNGRIYTIDPNRPTATDIAVGRGRILAVGDKESVGGLADAGTATVNLDGRCITPGLVDAHVHFQSLSLNMQRVDVYEAPTLEEALQRIAAYSGNMKPDRWLQGHGWNHELWANHAYPNAAHLDNVAAHTPVYLTHKSGHAAWVNSRALKLAGVTALTPDPPGGQIQRDASGQPTGILFEDAMDLVSDQIPRPSVEEIAAAMRQAQEACWQAGLVGLHDFDGRSCFQALQGLHLNGELGLRVVKNIPVYRLEHAIGVGLRSGFGDDWLRIGGIKIFADGALGPHTASMIAPFEDTPGNYGIIVTDKEEMLEKVKQASAHGLSATIHAIGDRANHDVLDVYEEVRREEAARSTGNNLLTLRHRIEHVQLLHPQDLNRLGKLGVIASMQPIHATSDMEMADRYWGERARYSYAWRTMLDTGALLVFGSDAPVESIKPMLGIHAAVTRRRSDGQPGIEGWYPEQKLTIAETIHAFTMAAAITSGQETIQGSITPGKLADLTIFDADIFHVSPDELPDVQIAGTIVGGTFKHRTW